MARQMRSSVSGMLKQFNLLSAAALCSLLLVGCSNNDDDNQSKITEGVSAADSQASKEDPLNDSVFDDLQTKVDDSGSLASTNDNEVDSPQDKTISNNNDDLDESFYESSNKVSFSQEESTGVMRWEAPESVDYANATVTISDANGDRTSRTFSSGEPIELYGSLPDGLYSWETVIAPQLNEYTKEQMREVRESGDLHAEQELIAQLRADGSLPSKEQVQNNRQSGNFIVQDGVVRPSLVDGPVSDEDNGE